MIALAHVAGLPVEELLLPTLATAGASLLAARAWVSLRLRRRERRK